MTGSGSGFSEKERPGKLLHSGDRMEQPEFHALYSQMPEGYHAQLIGGVVYEPSPAGYEHSRCHGDIVTLLRHYAGYTPGVESLVDATAILGTLDEAQPDVVLRIMPAFGGQSRNVHLKEPAAEDSCEYVAGAPELVAEVAHTSRDVDLRRKKRRYALAGVLEYIVFCLKPARLYWFNLARDAEMPPDGDGVFRSMVFPGLWIDSQALLQSDYKRGIDTLSRGLQSTEHAQFASKLANASRVSGLE